MAYKMTSRVFKDVETDTLLEFDMIEKRARGKHFWKLYLNDFLSVLGLVDSRQLDILVYILDNTNPSTNLFLGTYSKIEEDIKCSRQTIAKIMKKLQENDFMSKVSNGVWMVNPKFLFKGDEKKKQILLSYYNDEN